jgi:hypothetical protein
MRSLHQTGGQCHCRDRASGERVLMPTSNIRLLENRTELEAALERAAMFERAIYAQLADRLSNYESRPHQVAMGGDDPIPMSRWRRNSCESTE